MCSEMWSLAAWHSSFCCVAFVQVTMLMERCRNGFSRASVVELLPGRITANGNSGAKYFRYRPTGSASPWMPVTEACTPGVNGPVLGSPALYPWLDWGDESDRAEMTRSSFSSKEAIWLRFAHQTRRFRSGTAALHVPVYIPTPRRRGQLRDAVSVEAVTPNLRWVLLVNSTDGYLGRCGTGLAHRRHPPRVLGSQRTLALAQA